jgi:NAD(P)-dependent dehydrogenase (short-subunit alcohol dehydrogenase family)
MTEHLTGKVAIVTGASRGIGRAISVALASEAATVILAARSLAHLQRAAHEVAEAGGTAEIVVTELTEEDSIKNLVRVTAEKFGRLDILVNNAGITHSAKLEETLTKDWERCLWVNARAPFILCRAIRFKVLIRPPNMLFAA